MLQWQEAQTWRSKWSPRRWHCLATYWQLTPLLQVDPIRKTINVCVWSHCSQIGGWSCSQFIYNSVKQFQTVFLVIFSSSQTNPRRQRWCFWEVSPLAFLSHSVPSSSKYTVEQTATMATVTTLTIATGTGIIGVTITAVPTISPLTLIQTALLLLPLEGPGLLGTANQRTGMTRLTRRHGDAEALRELCCTTPCSHQLRVCLTQTHTVCRIQYDACVKTCGSCQDHDPH